MTEEDFGMGEEGKGMTTKCNTRTWLGISTREEGIYFGSVGKFEQDLWIVSVLYPHWFSFFLLFFGCVGSLLLHMGFL